MEMFGAKEELPPNKDNLPNVTHSVNPSKSGHSPKPGHKRKKRKKKQETTAGRRKNDNDILVENDLLVYRTDSLPSTAGDSNFVENHTFSRREAAPHRSGDLKREKGKVDFPEDVRKVALTLAVSNALKRGVKENLATFDHVDYVLVFSENDKHSEMSNQVLKELRKNFEKKVELEGVSIVRKTKGDLTFVIMSCSFERLCKEAEAVSLKMPLAGVGLARGQLQFYTLYA